MKWTYHTSHSFVTREKKKVSLVTQLYSIGVYAIINNDASLQFNWEPKDLVKTEKNLRKQEKAGEITDLQFGIEITVSDVTGFFEKVES